MKRNLLLLSLTILSLTVFANDKLQLTSRHISTTDGLAGNTIYELVQDPDGYIWMATNNGLSRYDGYSIVNYTTLDRKGQDETERVGRITCDTTEQLLWISTSIFTNACYDLRKKQFIDWTDDAERQLNKFYLSSRGIFFYGMSFGVRHAEHRQVRDFTSENGLLPSNEVNKVTEDRFHRIWMFTNKGATILTSDGQSKILLKGTNIITGATDTTHTYILSSTGDIIAFDQNLNYRTIAHLTAIKQFNTSFVWRDQWLIFTTEDTYAIDIKSGKISTLDISNGRNQGECLGYHFIGNDSGRLWIFPKDGDMQSMLLIPNAQYSNNRGRKFHIASDKEGRMFIATYGNGLFIWTPQTGEVTHYAANDDQPLFATDYLTYAISDQQDNIWLGTEISGTYCLTLHADVSQLIQPEPQHKGDRANYISTIARNPVTNTYTIGTRWGNSYQYTIGNGQMLKTGSLSSWIAMSFYDHESHFWQGTDKSELYVDGQRYPLPHVVTAFCQDAQGRIWIGTYGGGLYVTTLQDLQEQQYKQFLTGNMNKSRIKALALDGGGRLWIGTNDGIYSVDTKGTSISENDFRCYNRANKLFSHNEIYTLFCNNDSTVWIGAAGSGLLKCHFPADGGAPHTKRVTSRDGLPNNSVYSICADRQGHIWVATEGGMACVNSQNLLVSRVNQRHIATENAALYAEEGHVLLGTTEGLLDISVLQDSTTQEREEAFHHVPRITDLHINGISLQESERQDGHHFSHDENTISFYYSDFNYAASSNALYQYYLEGVEADWQPTTTDYHTDYRNLRPGRYVFYLRAYSNGVWTEPVTYAFTIHQPWYNTWWAWIVYLVILALVAWYVYRNWKDKFDLHQQIKLDRQLMEFRTRLFTNITHEFRTPLAIIKGAVDKLDDKQSAVQTAQRATKRMLKLVNQFMEFRKATTGHLRLQVEQGEIVAFIKDIQQDFWAMAQQKNLQMTFTPSVREYKMLFDKDMVETIIYNLLSNAIKYTPEKGSVTMRLKIENEELRISCEDSGLGISEKQKEALFKPFMNGLSSQGGMGIGLYTAYTMAKTHHGSLTYSERKDERGSLFTLILPATDIYTDEERRSAPETVVSDDSATDASTMLLQEVMPEALNDLTIAIIEDDPDMMEQIKHEVGIYFHTDTYMNGQTGYEGVKANPPALLICDVMLPDMNGYEIVSMLKQNAQTANIPIIMLTALADESHQIKAYKAGADDYMTKPCNWRLLVARTMQLIKWRQAQPVTPEPSDTADNPSKSVSADEPSQPTLITSQAEKVFMMKLEMLTAQHLSDEKFNIDQLAQLMAMGRTKFYGKVKEMTGVSPNKYIMQARMKKAADLLADGEMNVSEVSYKVGVQDPSYFNKIFKAYYGVVPSKYVKPAE